MERNAKPLFRVKLHELRNYQDKQKERINSLCRAIYPPGATTGFKKQHFELGVCYVDDEDKTKFLQRELVTVDQIIADIPTLNRKVAQNGVHVYIRPNHSSSILVDDISLEAARCMWADGYEPSAVVETSDGNFQVWITVSELHIMDVQATAIAKLLASKYGGDPASAAYRHFGRLVGFPNTKFKYKDANGRYPITRIHYAKAKIATKGDVLLRETAHETRKPKLSLEELYKELAIVSPVPLRDDNKGIVELAKGLYSTIRVQQKRGGIDPETKRSETDFLVILKLLRFGYQPLWIHEALECVAPNIERKSNVDYYLNHTIKNALKTLVDAKKVAS